MVLAFEPPCRIGTPAWIRPLSALRATVDLFLGADRLELAFETIGRGPLWLLDVVAPRVGDIAS
eukprot:scaffold54891_cov69-Phaeocystis_antarctica.AAC.2